MKPPLFTADQAMLLIVALDPGASVRISDKTGAWFVMADVGVSDGQTVTSVCEHTDSPDTAILAYLERLMEVTDSKHWLLAKPYGERRHYRWNGATFAELPMPTPLERSA